MTTSAKGTFDVKVTPQQPMEGHSPNLGRFELDKQFHGDLEAISKGQMLTAGSPVQGSAGYVAVEQVTGTLHGRTGSFALQHIGTMKRGAPEMKIAVVPDSGTEELQGIAGTLTITVTEGTHFYQFDYSLD